MASQMYRQNQVPTP